MFHIGRNGQYTVGLVIIQYYYIVLLVKMDMKVKY